MAFAGATGSCTTRDMLRIVALCGDREVLSIAEIAAYLDLPPSLAKIVVADLLDMGALKIPKASGPLRNLELLWQVLDGLRSLDSSIA